MRVGSQWIKRGNKERANIVPPSFGCGSFDVVKCVGKVWERECETDLCLTNHSFPLSSNLFTLHHTLQIWPLSVELHYIWSIFFLSAIFSLVFSKFSNLYYPINKHFQNLDCRADSQLLLYWVAFDSPNLLYPSLPIYI